MHKARLTLKPPPTFSKPKSLISHSPNSSFSSPPRPALQRPADSSAILLSALAMFFVLCLEFSASYRDRIQHSVDGRLLPANFRVRQSTAPLSRGFGLRYVFLTHFYTIKNPPAEAEGLKAPSEAGFRNYFRSFSECPFSLLTILKQTAFGLGFIRGLPLHRHFRKPSASYLLSAIPLLHNALKRFHMKTSAIPKR